VIVERSLPSKSLPISIFWALAEWLKAKKALDERLEIAAVAPAVHFQVLSQDNFQANGSQPAPAITGQFLDKFRSAAVLQHRTAPSPAW
jgi:hypothetical protein